MRPSMLGGANGGMYRIDGEELALTLDFVGEGIASRADGDRSGASEAPLETCAFNEVGLALSPMSVRNDLFELLWPRFFEHPSKLASLALAGDVDKPSIEPFPRVRPDGDDGARSTL